jgi:uncharacterized protein (DUF983 family)
MANTPEDKKLKTDRDHASRSVSPYMAGLKARCPKCGEGALYVNGLSVREKCDVCGFDLSAADPGDGAQVFVILIMGAIAALAGFILIGGMKLPTWIALTIIFLLVIFGSIWMLRVFKALLIALQFHHDARQGSLEGDDEN